MGHHLDDTIADASQAISYLKEQIAESATAIEKLEAVREDVRIAIQRHERVIADLTHSLSMQQERRERAQADKAESEA